ncbi:MAG: hypothetical protein V7K89_09410 [Nostoc sp.]|uniref:hypothetical protein n=1 Tax=Nostoc sp. TaxID=1180 RepID=UPI002FF61B57
MLLKIGWTRLVKTNIIAFAIALSSDRCDRIFRFALEQAIEADRLRCEKQLGNAMSRRGGH